MKSTTKIGVLFLTLTITFIMVISGITELELIANLELTTFEPKIIVSLASIILSPIPTAYGIYIIRKNPTM